MDVHLALGIQRLLDLKPKFFEMTASVMAAGNHGPCIQNDLELLGGCEHWVDGSKTGATYRLRWSPQGDFSKVLSVHKV